MDCRNYMTLTTVYVRTYPPTDKPQTKVKDSV